MAMIPTQAGAWKSTQTDIVKLPSGNVAELQTPSLLALFAGGGLPRVFADVFKGGMTGAQANVSVEDVNPADISALADALVVAAFVSPSVVREHPDAGRNQIALGQVSDADKMFVMTRSMQALGYSANAPEVEQGTKSVGE